MYVAGQVLQMQYADALRENGPFLHRMQCGTARQAAQGSVEFEVFKTSTTTDRLRLLDGGLGWGERGGWLLLLGIEGERNQAWVGSGGVGVQQSRRELRQYLF